MEQVKKIEETLDVMGIVSILTRSNFLLELLFRRRYLNTLPATVSQRMTYSTLEISKTKKDISIKKELQENKIVT